MSTAATGMPVDPLAGVAPALQGFRTQVQRGQGALRSLTDRIKHTATSVGTIGTSADHATTAVRRTKAAADTTARSLAHTGRTAATGARGIKSVGRSATFSVRSLGKLAVGLGGLLSLITGLIDVSGPLGTLMDTFGTAMTIGAGVMLVVNYVTRTTPVGFISGLLLPVAGWLLDLAMNSATGQRLMEQLAKLVLTYVRSYLKIMTPLLKVIAKVVGTYVSVWLTVITTALRVIGGVVSTGFAVLKALTTGDTRALHGRAAAVWRGFKSALKPVLKWIEHDIPRMFSRVKSALRNTLGGMGRFVTTGAQAVAGVIKGPINGLISFANWIIEGLNKISFSFFGKKFGIHLSKIPMLAEGGIAIPGAAPGTGHVLPLSQLALSRLARHRPGLRSGSVRVQPPSPYELKAYHEPSGATAWSTAEELLFLAAAHAPAHPVPRAFATA
ncbi:tape-measure protein [Streptomyces beihaiensis]|uniref:Tape-measure protein n=1 Tax=Streptomyces beihaiensis TaxID=2984495 RepID=A0ABT3TYL4_9ACTN|nr:tape-measure protein [Streptomyces beihaiensis]MCX3061875.1 tape-measure protein [Streptomyces beihaiensis]